jgi:hypothetical protein
MTDKAPQFIAEYSRADIETVFRKTLTDEQWQALVGYVDLDNPVDGDVGKEIATGVKFIDQIMEDNRKWLLKVEEARQSKKESKS